MRPDTAYTPGSIDMADVVVYRTDFCPYCDRAERLLDDMDVDFEEIDVTDDPDLREELVEKTGRKTVPQIFINDAAIGGYESLRELKSSGELQELLAEDD
jgi:glutaredoxin 3